MDKESPISLLHFAGPEEGLKILTEGKVSWSAPHLIPDPFENSLRTGLGFDRDQLERTMIEKITEMVFSFDDPSGAGRNTPIQKAVRRWRSEDRFNNKEEVEAALIEVVPGLVDQHYQRIIGYMGRWQAFSKEVRVHRLFEDPESLSCWSEHAQSHRGLAIKFKVGDGLMVSAPKPVRYRQKREVVTSMDDQVGIILGDVAESNDGHFYNQLLAKPRYLSEQKEWRSFSLPEHFELTSGGADEQFAYPYDNKPVIDENAYSQVGFTQEEVLAVYVGSCASHETINTVLRICASKYPQMKVYLAKSNSTEFQLDFRKL